MENFRERSAKKSADIKAKLKRGASTILRRPTRFSRQRSNAYIHSVETYPTSKPTASFSQAEILINNDQRHD